MVEFKTDERTGEPVLMEINGRFWGSLQLAIDAGVDFPRLLVECAEGRPPSARRRTASAPASDGGGATSTSCSCACVTRQRSRVFLRDRPVA